VTWRDGVHLTGTSIWCDATRRRDVCFVSAADRQAKSAQLIGTPLTLALVGADAGNLAVPLRQRFTLGTLRLELIASGRGPGAAALYVEGAGIKLLYASAVRPYEGKRVAAADVRACDVLVVDAPFGASKKKFPDLDGVIDKTLAWTRKQLAGGKRPILLVDTALDGLEVATVLAAEGLALAGAKPIRDAADRMASLDQTVMRKKTSAGTSGRSAKAPPMIALAEQGAARDDLARRTSRGPEGGHRSAARDRAARGASAARRSGHRNALRVDARRGSPLPPRLDRIDAREADLRDRRVRRAHRQAARRPREVPRSPATNVPLHLTAR
jgi:hypothetical protein